MWQIRIIRTVCNKESLRPQSTNWYLVRVETPHSSPASRAMYSWNTTEFPRNCFTHRLIRPASVVRVITYAVLIFQTFWNTNERAPIKHRCSLSWMLYPCDWDWASGIVYGVQYLVARSQMLRIILSSAGKPCPGECQGLGIYTLSLVYTTNSEMVWECRTNETCSPYTRVAQVSTAVMTSRRFSAIFGTLVLMRVGMP